MIGADAEWIAAAAQGDLVAPPGGAEGPHRAIVDSRESGRGDLFFGLPGARTHGGEFARAALERGAWGVVVERDQAPACARAAAAAGRGQAVLAVDAPLAALAELARAWRARLACSVVGITGSAGKTSTKDILAAMLARRRPVVATPQNLNTEIGLPLTILAAPIGTAVLVLEMAMRGRGQIAELARIAAPDVGCILNVGPVHTELLGSVANVAAAKAELIAALAPGSTIVVPAGEPLLAPFLRADLDVVTFGEGGDFVIADRSATCVTIRTPDGYLAIEPSFSEEHNVSNLLAATACAVAMGERPAGRLDVEFSALRGELLEAPPGITVINDCYNANPISMRAALSNLVATPVAAGARRAAVLGEMAELGDASDAHHAEIGRHAARIGVDLVIAVGAGAARYANGFAGADPTTAGARSPVASVDSTGRFAAAADPRTAAALLAAWARPGDVALVKGSRAVGMEAVVEALFSDRAAV